MTDSLTLAEFVEMGLEVDGGNGEIFIKETKKSGSGLRLLRFIDYFGFVLKGKELDSVAGGEDEAFADSGLVEERAGGIGETGGGDGEALTNLDGRGVVVNAEEDETSLGGHAHGAANLWTEEN
jgi:hypothetical protein